MSQIRDLAEAIAWFEQYPARSVEGEAWALVRARARVERHRLKTEVETLAARVAELEELHEIHQKTFDDQIARVAELEAERDTWRVKALTSMGGQP